MIETKPKYELLTIRQFVEKHRAFTEGGLRYLIFNRKTNGFDNCVKRMGRKILLDEGAVLQWLDTQEAQ